jgi:hypothetical protein
MKRLFLILSLCITSFVVNAQTDTIYNGVEENIQPIDSAKFSDYKVCMTCATNNTQTTSNKINAYATGQSKSQQRILSENAFATEVSNRGRAFVRTLGAIVITAVSMAIITKTTQMVNEALYR